MERYLFTYLPRLDPRLHFVVLVAPFIVLAAVAWVYFIGPDWRAVEKLRVSRAMLVTVLNSGEEIANELATAHQAVARLEDQIFGKNMNLPMKQLEAQIIGRLQLQL